MALLIYIIRNQLKQVHYYSKNLSKSFMHLVIYKFF